MKSKLPLIIVLILALFITSVHAQTSSPSRYFDQELPGTTPKVFAPGVISLPDFYEFGSVFSNSGKEFFYAVNVGPIAEIRCIKMVNQKWSAPITIITSEKYSHNDPFLSPDDKKLFFISDRAIDGHSAKKDYDIWYMTRNGDSWSAPVNAGPSINTNKDEYYVSFTKSGTMYFSSDGRTLPGGGKHDVCSAAANGNSFSEAKPLPGAINTTSYEADVFVAPDESYLIFCGDRPDGHGNGDLYISFKGKDKQWSAAKNMGSIVNTPGHELCPFVTQDGKYFFYTSNKDIYWVDAKIIDTLR